MFCFLSCLHFLTSLIKLILWLKFFHRQKEGWAHGRGGEGMDHGVLLHSFQWNNASWKLWCPHEEKVLIRSGIRKSLGNPYAGCYHSFFVVFIKEVFKILSVGAGEKSHCSPAESAILVWILSGCRGIKNQPKIGLYWLIVCNVSDTLGLRCWNDVFISQFSPLSPLQLSWLHSQASDCHIRGMWPQKLPSCIIFTVSCLRGKRDFSLYLQQILSRFCLKSWLTCLGFGLYLNQFRRMGALRLVRPTMWLLFRGLGKEETPLWASRMMGKCPGKRVCGS